ncbi:Galactose-1-phosphate uridylyltransferase [Caloramator mitchellensis]|uniref:Galactose-1-phosphate uridylyltransferase n=1 Tax=Caloramator mitchellensis TaxID=908809 RepID=A0A0R3JSB3_CALMK|nr:DUF4931 domain-containing protein [Caloramator mitchellensis]KRQ86369.1 Galactose-1-phosphate uridylyltransferase [Caloramator mitchellensis]
MAELRLNEITKEQILIVENRSKRPKDFKTCQEKVNVSFKENCPFCCGNEELTPPEVYRDSENWNVRVVENKFPILNSQGKIKGYHYVLIEGRHHSRNIHEMSKEEFLNVTKAFVKVSEMLYQKDDVEYVQLFKNYKKEAGASLEHPHSQIIAINKMPEKINRTLEKSKKYFEKNSECLLCKTINYEIQHEKRIIHLDNDFIVYSPYASIYPYEIAILPLEHRSSLLNMNDEEIEKLSDIIQETIKSLINNVGDVPYNLYFDFIKEEKEYYHYQVRICPRLSIHAGFEIATGLFTNIVSPETSACILAF